MYDLKLKRMRKCIFGALVCTFQLALFAQDSLPELSDLPLRMTEIRSASAFPMNVPKPNGFSSDFNYFGVSMNHYIHGLTPIEIYAYDVNAASSTTTRYKYLDYAPGFVVGHSFGSGSVNGSFEFSRSGMRASSSYSAYYLNDTSTIVPVDEKIKVINSQVKTFINFQIPKLKRFQFGASIDIGVINNRIKRKGEGFSGKWEKFYTHTGLLNDYAARNFTAGTSLRVSMLLGSKFLMSLSRQFLLLDASMSGYSGKNVLLNSQNFTYSLSYVF